MRSHLLTVTAGAGLALIFLTASPANSITITTLASVRQAADAQRLIDAVHCRRYPHRHKNGHRWSRGCAVGAVSTGVPAQSLIGPSPGNFINPSNPQDRSGSSNPQDMTRPRAINPQDMR